jgi:hypothetical protein
LLVLSTLAWPGCGGGACGDYEDCCEAVSNASCNTQGLTDQACEAALSAIRQSNTSLPDECR